jgi:hypothetical protein
MKHCRAPLYVLLKPSYNHLRYRVGVYSRHYSQWNFLHGNCKLLPRNVRSFSDRPMAVWQSEAAVKSAYNGGHNRPQDWSETCFHLRLNLVRKLRTNIVFFSCTSRVNRPLPTSGPLRIVAYTSHKTGKRRNWRKKKLRERIGDEREGMRREVR